MLISIHVLREEDDYIFAVSLRDTQISIHVLREEDDSILFLPASPSSKFLSTSSARRTTFYTRTGRPSR